MKLTTRERKKFRIRGKLKKVSNQERYRLSVSRSSKNISAQIIDDNKNITILSASSNDKSIKSVDKKSKTELSKVVAENLAKKANKEKIKTYNGFLDEKSLKKNIVNLKLALTFKYEQL